MANGLVQLVVLSGILRIASSSQPCIALFHTPGLNTSVTAGTNSSFTVDFELRKVNCRKETFKKFKIVVAKQGKGGNVATYCEIHHDNDSCNSHTKEHCTCLNETYKYQFRGVATHIDKNTKWMLYSDNDRIEKKTLSMNILYAANVRDVSLTSNKDDPTNAVKNGSSAEVICFWENGNPPVKARLLDRRGKELNGDHSEGQIRYKFPAVTCEDSGAIRCEAPGASQNKSVSLLVKCPPKVKSPEKEVEIMQGEETRLTVEVLSYTRDIKQCKIHKMNQKPESSHRQCQISSVGGTPPDLTVTLQTDNVRKEEEGQWQLELTNDAGSAHYNFSVTTRGRPLEVKSVNVTIIQGGTTELEVEVWSHTRDINECTVRMLNQVPTATPIIQHCRILSVAGTPPNLTLTVRLDSVSKQKEGQWRLELTNDVGTGQHDFKLEARKVGTVVTNLTLNRAEGESSQVMDVGSTVDVNCSWNSDNTSVKAHLLDRHGIEMEGSIYNNGQVGYRFQAVGCQDAGLIRCEAPGASQNKSVPLLVRCPPEIQILQKTFSLGSGDDLEVGLTAWSHTKDLNCLMFSMASAFTPIHRCRIFSLNGTPPELTLTVRLENVRKEEEGQWRLNLTNDAGTGYDDFVVQISEQGGWMVIVVPSVLGVVIGIVIASVIVIKKVRRGGNLEVQQVEDRVSFHVSDHSSDKSRQSFHPYDETQDAEEQLPENEYLCILEPCEDPSDEPHAEVEERKMHVDKPNIPSTSSGKGSRPTPKSRRKPKIAEDPDGYLTPMTSPLPSTSRGHGQYTETRSDDAE